MSSTVLIAFLRSVRRVEPVDQFGKFGLEALVVVVRTLAHDVAHLPIAVGGLSILPTVLVHDAETVPAVGLVRISHQEIAGGCLGLIELADLDELDHGVGGIGNLIILIVPYQSVGNGLFGVMDVQATSCGEFNILLCLVLRQAALLVLLTAATGAGIIASGFGHSGQDLEARGERTFVCNLSGGRHLSRFSPCM